MASTHPFKLLSSRQLRAALAVCAAAFGLWLSHSRVFDNYELKTYDLRFQLRGLRPFSPEIVFIDIWDDTLEALSRFPIEREYYGGLIQVLGEFGAKSVVFDIEFVEPHPQDGYVTGMAKKFGNVYFATGFNEPKLYPTGYIATKTSAKLLSEYESASRGTGFVNTAVDRDGKWRRVMPLIGYGDRRFVQLGVRVAMDAIGADPEAIVHEPKRFLELKPGFRIPLDESDLMIINYAGSWKDSFRHYSFIEVLQSYGQMADQQKPMIDLNVFKNKICIVGLTAQGTHDMKPTPLESIYPGVGIYANVINSVLQRDFLRRLDRLSNVWILILMLCTTLWAAFHRKPLASFFYTLAMLMLFILGGIVLFIYGNLWIDMFYPALACVIVYVTGTLTRIMREMRKRELIEGELRIASQIQKSFLPGAPPEQKGLGLAAFFRPAKEVGGDLYAFVPMGTDKTGVMVGDVSGKGTPAALFMAKTMSEFKFSSYGRTDPAETLAKLNDSIASESTGGLFVTLTYAIFDLGARKLTLANAGHLPVVVSRADGSTELLTADGGMPIGVMPDVPFSNLERPLADGECYAFYTDGISEARNKKKEEYDVQRLQKAMSDQHRQAVAPALDYVIQDVTRFTGKADQHDDMTLILVRNLQGLTNDADCEE